MFGSLRRSPRLPCSLNPRWSLDHQPRLSAITDAEEPPTWTDLWAHATDVIGSGEEARRIVEQASGKSGASWLVIIGNQAPEGAAERVEAMTSRRQQGEPLQYVLGRWGFRNLELYVDKRVLIPRPETEQVTEAAIKTLQGKRDPFAVDLGTGSGAIALSIATEVTSARVFATDKSAAALEVAKENRQRLDLWARERVQFLKGEWFDALPDEIKGSLDLIVSNPPYVAERDRAAIDKSVTDWEPNDALFSGEDGLDDIRHIVGEAAAWLRDDGWLVLELAPDQAEEVLSMTLKSGFSQAEIGKDLAGKSRWIAARKSG